MDRICAWCLGTRSDAEGTDEEARGICRGCSEDLRYSRGSRLSSRLEGLVVPVLVVDREGIVQAANTRAWSGLSPERFSDPRPGDFLGCAHASLPGGCGRTEHCSECAIRRAFTQTLETGLPVSRVPATVDGGPGGSRAVDLELTAARVGGFVVLRVDRMGSAEPEGPGEKLPRPELPAEDE